MIGLLEKKYGGTTIEERFWSHVDSSAGPYGCWIWTRTRNNKDYGMVSGKSLGFSGTILAHRLSWFLAHGEYPSLCVLHRCDNPPCVNPVHLFLGTISDNAKDMMAKGRSKTAYTVGNNRQARETHCPNGHPYSGDNLQILAGKAAGHRRCRACVKEYKRLLYLRQKEMRANG